MIHLNGKYTTANVMIDDVESECIAQITHFINHPAFTNPVVIQPDCHAGKGSCIGFTMPMSDKLIPNIVGVDVGCGLVSVNIGKSLNLSFEDLDHKIRQSVPFGQEVHEDAVINMKNDFPWKKARVLAEKFTMAYLNRFGVRIEPPQYDMDWFTEKCRIIGGGLGRVINSLGSLGGGNHFIEIGLDKSGSYWITAHTGSRNFGKRICDYWQNRAVKVFNEDKKQELKERVFKIKQELKYEPRKIKMKIAEAKSDLNLDEKIDMKGCEWLEGDLAAGYLFDMIFSQVYAETNREYIIKLILKALKAEPEDQIETVHNFIDFRDFIIRKGAIRAYKDERFLLPFNMRDGILVCNGKSNPEWNYSAPHGAGRVMSRAQAKKRLDLEAFKKQMEGIYSTSVCPETIDEAPDAYKDSAVIKEAIGPTADILFKIKPVHNMKATSDFNRRRNK